jgi:hypothetical protein
VSVNIQEIHVRGLGAEPSADGQLLRLTIDGTKGEVIHAILQAHGLVPLAGVLLKVGVDETVRAVKSGREAYPNLQPQTHVAVRLEVVTAKGNHVLLVETTDRKLLQISLTDTQRQNLLAALA